MHPSSSGKKEPKKSKLVTPDVPHELIATQILVHLPVRSLLRFRCVCKSWHHTIDNDYFIQAHLRVRNLSLLVAPLIKNTNDDRGEEFIIAGLHRWDHKRNPGGAAAATLIHDMADYDHLPFPDKRNAHDLAHCDGLVLLPTDAKVIVLNPATRRVLTLPSSPHSVRPPRLPAHIRGHQAFGFGHDLRSSAYKVARFFYRCDKDGYHCTTGMEVFTLKTDKHWRETAVPPPYPVMAGRTATFFKGSLLWTAQASLLPNTQGFIRFNLEDESFSITPPPPTCGPGLDYAASSLAELRGELCLCVPGQRGADGSSLEMWMCADLGTNDEAPRWHRRYIIRFAPFCRWRYFRLISMLDEEPVFQAGSDHLVLYGIQNGDGVFNDMVSLKDTMYQNADNDSKHSHMLVEYIDVIPYVESLVPL
ncbi:putative F-box protein At3g52320 [Lolium perenne]|uniref:putative F-box protein At3g52320 n=1 Tax=Lolium perenne TaxID=4522 RepID=UPI0021F54C40|nr:putative F-box protein At3g52320 [Lolium perenne]